MSNTSTGSRKLMSTCSRREYSCRAYSRREYAGRDIAVTAITGDADDGRVLEFAAQLQRRPQGAPRRRAAKQAFLAAGQPHRRSEEHTSELQSLMRISYAVFCLKK